MISDDFRRHVAIAPLAHLDRGPGDHDEFPAQGQGLQLCPQFLTTLYVTTTRRDFTPTPTATAKQQCTSGQTTIPWVQIN